jgi:hypothetical protein
VPSQVNAQASYALAVQHTLGLPQGGPKCLPIRLDFATNAEWVLDYSNQTNLGYLDMCQCLWVDNYGNDSILTITIPNSQQTIRVPAQTQGYFPCLCPNPILMRFQSDGGTVQQVTLTNFPINHGFITFV